MNKKKEKSPILVIATIIFLLLFIVLPPLFRVLFPKETVKAEEDVVPNVTNYILTCEKMLSDENTKVINEIVYKDGAAITNTITYMNYTSDIEQNASLDENVDTEKTISEELTYFKTIPGIQVTEDVDKTVVVIPKMVVTNNPENLDLANYLLDVTKQTSYLEGQGFTCTKVDN